MYMYVCSTGNMLPQPDSPLRKLSSEILYAYELLENMFITGLDSNL